MGWFSEDIEIYLSSEHLIPLSIGGFDFLSLKWLPTRHPSGGPRKVVRHTSQKRGVGGRYKVGSHWLTNGI